MSNHSLQRKLPKWGKKTYVNWSNNPGRKALVFIHGFNGSSTSTFGDFNLEFRYLPEYKEYDVYFYNYDSLFTQIPTSSLLFLDFLKSIAESLPDVVRNSGAKMARPDAYVKIVVVAHSLGAVVSRHALNDGHAAGYTFLDLVELVLFAPAHYGANKGLSRLVGGLPRFLKPLGNVAGFIVVTYDQLTDPQIIINPMRTQCQQHISNGIKTFTIAKRVVWAQMERVVLNYRFLEDPNAIVISGKEHIQVCKPNRAFREPFEILEPIL